MKNIQIGVVIVLMLLVVSVVLADYPDEPLTEFLLLPGKLRRLENRFRLENDMEDS